MALGVREAGCWSAAVALLLYVNTLDCDLVFDDEPAIKWNKDLRPTSSWGQLLVHDFWGNVISSPISHKSYRPLCVATFRLNYMLHGLHPMGYHLVNVLLHAVVCYLYVQLCALVFTQVWPALLAGLLFAAHPVHTEAVAGVVGRAELLSAILFLGAIHIYHLSLSNSGQRSWFLTSLAIALSVCAMLSKEQGITALGLCLIYDLFIFNKPKALQRKRSLFPTWPAIAYSKGFLVRGVVVAAATLVATVMRLLISNGAPSPKLFTQTVNPPLGQSAPFRQLSWLHLSYVNSWLLLSPSQLSVDWRYGAVSLIRALWDHQNLYTLTCIVFLVATSLIALSTTNKAVLFSLSLMVVPFLPASNLFFPVGFVVAERVLYLPSMGFCMLVAYGASRMLEKASRYHALATTVLKISLGCLLLTHSVKTLVRNRSWYSADTLNRAGVQFNPKNPVLLSNLGIERATQQEYHQAELLFRSSMRNAPRYSGGFYNYGMLMKLQHRYKEAEEPLLQAIKLGSRDVPTSTLADWYNELATVIATNSSRLDEALKLSRYVLTQHPTYNPIHSTHCSLLIKLNRTREFVPACEQAVMKNPSLSDTHYNLGVAYMKVGHLSQAETYFRNLLVLSESGSSLHTEGLSQLATVLQATGRSGALLEARQLWLQVSQQQPQNTEALVSLASVDMSLHRYAEARDTLEAVLAVDDSHKEALYRAGQLFYQGGAYQEAVTLLSRLEGIDSSYLDTALLLREARGKMTGHISRTPHHHNFTFV